MNANVTDPVRRVMSCKLETVSVTPVCRLAGSRGRHHRDCAVRGQQYQGDAMVRKWNGIMKC